jgi:glyoxylase-like metal-dependent hydrolase (beta-lactamase superfamily II)
MTIRVHHLNCGSLCPHGQRWINGSGPRFAPALMVCHCLLIETAGSLVLVDTGIGTQAIRQPASLGLFLRTLARPRLDPAETAVAQIRALGFSVADVSDIILTHLDPDHAGGLADFPSARVHLHQHEQSAMEHPVGTERARYRAALWAHGVNWCPHESVGERWFGFERIRPLPGADDDILLIPLAGHSRGHCGIAVREGPRWLLHCGDAYMYQGEIDPRDPRCTPGLRLMQWLDQADGAARLHNRDRLRDLAATHGSEVELFCSHDPSEWRRYQPAD